MMDSKVNLEVTNHAASTVRRRLAGAVAAAALLFGACSSGGGGSSALVAGAGGTSPRLTSIEFGRLVDVYGLDAQGTVELFMEDVLIGPDIKDERAANSTVPDPQIRYDFLNSDPDTLQPRLLITRTIGSTDFKQLFEALDDRVRAITPSSFGNNSPTQPFSVMPRNGALRATFSHDLGLSADFFVDRDPDTGQIIGQSNTEAVQVLEILGNPNDPNPIGDFRVLPSRVVPRVNTLIIDPVLLGSEGLQYQTSNNATGLPESADQLSANIRLAIALEGPLAIPGIRPDRVGFLIGKNNSGFESVIRDFRSGNRADNTPEISQGFVRDGLEPRIAGQILMYLERVDPIDEATQQLTFFKAGVRHEIDRGDAVRLVVDNLGVPAAITEVVVDPVEDAGQPAVQHVRVSVRRQFRTDASGQQVDIFEEWDPSDPTESNTFWQSNPGLAQTDPYPADLVQRELWLPQFAPKLVLVAEFTVKKVDAAGNVIDDDPRYFVTFTPTPLPDGNGVPSEPNENVSPFAGVIVRFTKPVDMSTVQALDSFFLATRDLLDPTERDAFVTQHNIDPPSFIEAKYATPHLVGASVFDEDGSQTNLRLQPQMGFYLDDNIRQDEGVAFDNKKFKYFMHLVGGIEGIRDLAGNPIDFQSEAAVIDRIVFPFSLDTRKNISGSPLFPDNLAVTVARRFEDPDEDEQPSYYLPSEVQTPQQSAAGQFNHLSFNLADLFGPVVYLTNGSLASRPASRVTQVVDDLNQTPPPDQATPARFCPEPIGSEPQVATASASVRFGSPLQNPLNPHGCRLQTIWREIDMSLSRIDPIDFNLDVEQLYWAPFTDLTTVFDEFDTVSLYLGHSEFRAEPCVGSFSSLPSLGGSGLERAFDDNYVANRTTAGKPGEQPQRHAAYVDKELTILATQAVLESNGVNRFLPLPTFQKPYFVWRDERLMLQGAQVGLGNDTSLTGNNFTPYILSPFLTGRGRYAVRTGEGLSFTNGAWDNRDNKSLARAASDGATGGLVGSIALPLLADFWTIPDSSSLPAHNPFLAAGVNGWQIALSVQSSPQPHFRAVSAGGLNGNGQRVTVGPGSTEWARASGGMQPNGKSSANRDNTVYWIMADYVKRMSVVTAGFVDILNPHRMPSVSPDARLGPYMNQVMPTNVRPRYTFSFEPPLQFLPPGTSINVEFRGAGPVDDLSVESAGTGEVGPWAAIVNQYYPANGQEIPDAVNFPLDPLKAGDAHIRKFDERSLNGKERNTWTYYYNRNVTDYTPDPNDLSTDSWTDQFSGPNEAFLGSDVTYFNWRFIFENNVDASPPTNPTLDSFSVTYRLEKTN